MSSVKVSTLAGSVTLTCHYLPHRHRCPGLEKKCSVFGFSPLGEAQFEVKFLHVTPLNHYPHQLVTMICWDAIPHGRCYVILGRKWTLTVCCVYRHTQRARAANLMRFGNSSWWYLFISCHNACILSWGTAGWLLFPSPTFIHLVWPCCPLQQGTCNDACFCHCPHTNGFCLYQSGQEELPKTLFPSVQVCPLVQRKWAS